LIATSPNLRFAPLSPRSRSRRNRLVLAGLVVLAAVAVVGCTDVSQARLAQRILAEHRTRARLKPLPAAQLVRVRLASPSGDASGTETIEWEEGNYRETVSSAGVTTIRGIQAGKGYFTDEDGVTRLASEPLLARLITRFYFWKRGYLFDDQAEARVALGPADDATVSVQVTPRGGDPLLLLFGRRDLRLVSARSKHFDLVFSSPTRFRDSSRRDAPIDAEILWTGLPTGPLKDTAAGGWSASWGTANCEAPLARAGRATTIPARISGQPAAIAVDATEDGPLRLRSALADRLRLSFARDVFGRMIARGARLEIGGLAYPSLTVERSDSLPDDVDAAAGAPLFRETVVEIDPAANLVRFHDPARWTTREGFFRVLLDDDGNRPAAIVQRRGERLRLLVPTAIAGPLSLTPEAVARLGLSGRTAEVTGLRWGVALPALPAIIESGSQVELGEDGGLGWDLVLRFHAFFDMPHRWMYLRPTE